MNILVTTLVTLATKIHPVGGLIFFCSFTFFFFRIDRCFDTVDFEIIGTVDFEIGGTNDFKIDGTNDFKIDGTNDFKIDGTNDFKIGGTNDLKLMVHVLQIDGINYQKSTVDPRRYKIVDF